MTYRIQHSQFPPPDLYWHNSGAPHVSPPVAYLRHSQAIANGHHIRKLSSATMTRESRKYIDPWDLENFDYIQRTTKTSPEPTSHTDSSVALQSPAGEPIASTFFYVPADVDGNPNNVSDYEDDEEVYEERHHELQMHPADDDGFDCTTGCYAGLDEELFYNAKYESIHDDPAYSMYYTDLESSSTDRTSSCGGSSVSTLQLHTPGFGVRASGRRSIVLPKPEPHIEFPPAPPAHEFYAGFPQAHQHIQQADHHLQMPPHMIPAAFHDDDLLVDDMAYQTVPRHPAAGALYTTGGGTSFLDGSTASNHFLGSEANTYCSLTECAYDCVPDHVPVYAISNPATMRRRSTAVGSPPIVQPPNNFGLSKRGLLQIDYSFNWNNLHRFISK